MKETKKPVLWGRNKRNQKKSFQQRMSEGGIGE